MKKLIKSFLLSVVSFTSIAYFYPGFSFKSFEVVLFASLTFGLINLTLRPALKIFSLPLNLFTFGLFSFLSGALIIFLVSAFVSGFNIVSFDFSGAEISGFFVPTLFIFPPLSALIASVLISWLNTALRWVFN